MTLTLTLGWATHQTSFTGLYELGVRNTRDSSLIKFAERHHMMIMNTLFKKRVNKRWAWSFPNGAIKNEVDFILTNKSHTFTGISGSSTASTQ